MCVRADHMLPVASIQLQPSPCEPDPDAPVLSLFFHQLHDQWAAAPWRRCLKLTAVLSWQSLFPADTNSMSLSYPALPGPPALRIHTRPCPSWKCLKKRWGMFLLGCFPGGVGVGLGKGSERCSFPNYPMPVLYNVTEGPLLREILSQVNTWSLPWWVLLGLRWKCSLCATWF